MPNYLFTNFTRSLVTTCCRSILKKKNYSYSKYVPPLILKSYSAGQQKETKLRSSRLDRDTRIAELRGATSKKLYIHNYLTNLMKMNPEVEKVLNPLRQEVKEQGDLVRKLKENNAPKVDIDAAVRLLKDKKKNLELKESSLVPKESFVDRSRLEDVLKQRFFFDLSFSIYGGVAGLYDYGPPGTALKKNILRSWESHFILEEDLHEIEASQLTPDSVLKASGHVDRFADLMVKDLKNGTCYRLDHLIKNHLEKVASGKDCSLEKRKEIDKILAQLDGLSKEQLGDIVKKFAMKAPDSGNELSEPVEFNLMFSTSIGPTGLVKSFLRPETAQGIFTNFSRLLDANQGKLPFGAAQIGKSFRNEISPRGGLVRMREFTMAEIEYFVDPMNKKHAKYDSIKDLKLNLYSACNQMNGEDFKSISLSEAVDNGIIANQVLAYFLGRIYLFMLKIGIDPNKIRFRQHMDNEMAHYATDCWDCECLTSSGWLECVGCADRSCYDLSQHTNATGKRLAANRSLKTPKKVEFIECVPQKAVIGKELKSEAKAVLDELSRANNEELSRLEKELESGVAKLTIGDRTYNISKDMISIKREIRTVKDEEVVPNVIEPSFGIDRIIYSLLEHNFRIREDNQLRTYFSFPSIIAPIKCSVLPLSDNDEFMPFVEEILVKLKQQQVRPKYDGSSASIGKRYARTDEIGIPYGITIDFDTIKERTVTLRHCSSTEQIRVNIDAIGPLVRDLTTDKLDWSDVKKNWPEFLGQTETSN